MSDDLEKFSNEQLLLELIRRMGVDEAPTSRTIHDYEVLLGIGKCNYCYITFVKEDLEALLAMQREEEDE